MARLKPTQSIRADLDRAELVFVIGGYWTAEDMRAFLFDFGEVAKPLLRGSRPFDVLGDLTEFVPQDRETAMAIRDSLLAGRKNGLRRFAVISSSMLVKLQYRRITEGLEVEFFDDVHSARNWMREGDSSRGGNGGQPSPMPNPIPQSGAG